MSACHERTPARLLVPLLVITLALGACTGKRHQVTTTTTVERTLTSQVTETRSAPRPTFHPAPASTVAPLAPGQAPAAGEVERACPYIPSSQDQGENSLAALEGDRVYRTTVLTAMKPVGCRFYFYAGPYEAIAEISTRTFATPAAAHDAMVLTGRAGDQVQGKANIVPGVDAVLYRTKFFGPDGSRDWACTFAKGPVIVTVRTQRKDTSLSSLLIAQAVAPKF